MMYNNTFNTIFHSQIRTLMAMPIPTTTPTPGRHTYYPSPPPGSASTPLCPPSKNSTARRPTRRLPKTPRRCHPPKSANSPSMVVTTVVTTTMVATTHRAVGSWPLPVPCRHSMRRLEVPAREGPATARPRRATGKKTAPTIGMRRRIAIVGCMTNSSITNKSGTSGRIKNIIIRPGTTIGTLITTGTTVLLEELVQQRQEVVRGERRPEELCGPDLNMLCTTVWERGSRGVWVACTSCVGNAEVVESGWPVSLGRDHVNELRCDVPTSLAHNEY